MNTLVEMDRRGHEQVVFVQDSGAGLRAIIAIHSTVLGPALGGTRMHPYATQEDALRDVLELSRGMTYKAAAAGLDLAAERQSSSPILARTNPHGFFEPWSIRRSPEGSLLYRRRCWNQCARPGDHRHGDTVCGRARTRTRRRRRSVTRHCIWGPRRHEGMRSRTMGSPSLRGRRIALQGLGKVGWHLAQRLLDAGATVVGCDVDGGRAQAAREQLHIMTVDPEAIYDVAADIFAPCALGGAISDLTLPRLRVEIIAGSANNQILDPRVAEQVFHRDILYAPDM